MAIRKVANLMFGPTEVASENADPKALLGLPVKRHAGADISQPAKMIKSAVLAPLARKPLGNKSNAVVAAPDPKLAVKKAVAAPFAAPAVHTATAMDTKADVDFALDFVEGEEAIEDIDRDDDPQSASEYAKEISTYMRQLEVCMRALAARRSRWAGSRPDQSRLHEQAARHQPRHAHDPD